MGSQHHSGAQKLSIWIKIQKNGKNEVTYRFLLIRRRSVWLSTYFWDSVSQKALTTTPLYDQNLKKLKTGIDKSIVTNLKSLSMNIHLLFESLFPLLSPDVLLTIWSIEQYCEIIKITCSTSIPINSTSLRLNINLIFWFDSLVLPIDPQNIKNLKNVNTEESN